MVTRSGTGGSLPPVAGLIAPSVVRTRPDLKDMGGYIVRVPRSLDIDMNEDSQRVWVQAPEEEVEGEGPVSFPTIVLSAAELKLVKRCAEGREDVDEMLGGGDFGREMETVDPTALGAAERSEYCSGRYTCAVLCRFLCSEQT